MVEGKRQKQVAAVIQKEMDEIFRHLGLNMVAGGMVSIAAVKVTPDLLEARIYLSFYKTASDEQAMKTIKDREWEIKKQLALKVKNQLRRIPVLQFYKDDTLDHAFKMEEIFKQIDEEKHPGENESESA